MKTSYGTSNFVSKLKAVEYYRQQENISLAEAYKLVATKLEEKAIEIGRPALKDGESFEVNGEGRYFIVTK